jgi:hypothetical protein
MPQPHAGAAPPPPPPTPTPQPPPPPVAHGAWQQDDVAAAEVVGWSGRWSGRGRARFAIQEGNVVSAGAVFSASIVLDALTALPTTVVVDVPTSLRTTALVLAALVAAPPVQVDLIFEQRGLASVLLVIVAFVGMHNGGVNARIADSLYSLVCGWATLLIFALSGPIHGDRGYDAKGKRENVIALVAALLGYSGARIVRGGLNHAGEVASFSASHEDIEARGYALADDLVATTLVFGGTLCMCAAGIVLLNHDAIYERGCEPVASVAAQLSVLVFLAAFIVQIVCYARLDEMEALFGDSACVGDADVCANSFRARRLYTANSSPAALWACAVGMTIFAFPYDRRCRTRSEYFVRREVTKTVSSFASAQEAEEAEEAAQAEEEAAAEAEEAWCDRQLEREWQREEATGAGNVAFVASLVATVVVFSHADTAWPALELLLLFFSIPAAWYSSTWIACVLHASGMIAYTVGRLGSPLGFDLSFLTHWFVAATLLITVCLAITTFTSWLLYSSCFSTGRYIVWLENVTALLIVALVSMQLFLTIASLAVISGYDGSMVTTQSWRSSSLQWTTQHSLGFFFSAALVGGRFECHNEHISRWVLQVVWFAVPTILAALWLFTIHATSSFVPYGTTGDGASIAIATLAALLPWALSGVVLC